MERAALYHRPDSEYAYLYESEKMHIRLRTKKEDVKHIHIIKGDPYLIHEDKWYQESTEMKHLCQTAEFDYWMIETDAPFRRIQYAFKVEGYDGEVIFYGDRGIFDFNENVIERAENYFRIPFFQEIDRFKAPEWVKNTVWYQIFPERFANGDKTNDPKNVLPWGSKEHPGREDFYGGDLQGVLDNLDYLEELGINGIYFCPIFKASSNHKYDTIDYFEIDPDFGDKALFKKLVDEAHKRGIRIMLDAVFNHMGYASKEWQDVVKHQQNSKYVDWFHIRSFPVEYGQNGNIEGAKTLSYDTFAFTPRMPKLNTANPEVQEYLLKIAKYWIEEFDIDAWRLDVANEVDHHFWKRFYKETTAIKDDFYILGEIWHSSQSWLNGDEFHAVMNYAYTETILNFFVHEEMSSQALAYRLNEQLMLYRDQTNQVMFNMLDSHDTARLLTLADNDKDKLRSALLFTFLQHGSPCIYYGTEVGMTGGNDPDCRKCMVWNEEEQDLHLLSFTKEIINFRKKYQKVMSEGTLEFTAPNNELVALTRKYQTTSIKALFNNGNQKEKYATPEGYQPIKELCQNIDFSNQTIEYKGFIVFVSEK